MIPESRAEAALNFLTETDESCADAKADMERAEWKAKAKRQAVFLLQTGTVAERNALADTHPEVMAAMEAHSEAVAAYLRLHNRRATEAIVMDTWRTICANRRRG